MAYVSQEMKAKIAPVVKKICAKYGVKATLAVRNHSSLVLNIKASKIDFIANSNRVCGNDHYHASNGFKPNTSGYCDVNVYHYKSHYDGEALKFLKEIIPALQGPDYYDETDLMTDYFSCSHYYYINIGRWDRPVVVE
jgi:hypothetical protein